MARPRLLPDNFTLALLGAVAIATLLPARGQGVVVFEWITNLAIGLVWDSKWCSIMGHCHGITICDWAIHWRSCMVIFEGSS